MCRSCSHCRVQHRCAMCAAWQGAQAARASQHCATKLDVCNYSMFRLRHVLDPGSQCAEATAGHATQTSHMPDAAILPHRRWQSKPLWPGPGNQGLSTPLPARPPSRGRPAPSPYFASTFAGAVHGSCSLAHGTHALRRCVLTCTASGGDTYKSSQLSPASHRSCSRP